MMGNLKYTKPTQRKEVFEEFKDVEYTMNIRHLKILAKFCVLSFNLEHL